MNIFCKPYRRKDGSMMFYINNDRKVSLGFGENILSTKLSDGQKKLLTAFYKKFNEVSYPFTKTTSHAEDSNILFNDTELYITDVAKVCGSHVSSDGCYLYRNGRIANISDIKGDVEL